MAELNFGEKIMLMGGVRYEDTRQEYTSRSGSPIEEDEGGTGFLNLVDVSASSGYNELLPQMHLRYKTDRLDGPPAGGHQITGPTQLFSTWCRGNASTTVSK